MKLRRLANCICVMALPPLPHSDTSDAALYAMQIGAIPAGGAFDDGPLLTELISKISLKGLQK